MKNYDYAGVKVQRDNYPQDIRNCTKCHDGSSTATRQDRAGRQLVNKPNALACGACHDGINFATGKGVTLADAAKGLTATTVYPGARRTRQARWPTTRPARCATSRPPSTWRTSGDAAEQPDADALIAPGGQRTANTNSAWIASNQNRLPAGAIKVTYDIKSVSRNASEEAGHGVPDVAERHAVRPKRTFARRDRQDGEGRRRSGTTSWARRACTSCMRFRRTASLRRRTSTRSASVYLQSLWNGSAPRGTLSAPDADGTIPRR